MVLQKKKTKDETRKKVKPYIRKKKREGEEEQFLYIKIYRFNRREKNSDKTKYTVVASQISQYG